MVTVVKTPQGHKIIDQSIAATIIDSSGDALVTFPYHGLTTGAYVYIDSDIDEYNGFWYVTVIDYQTFKISEHSEADFVEFYQELDIDYYQTQSHDWSSIFLPIVYKATNDRWPTNTVDAAALIVLNSDDNGFTQLTLAGPLAGLDAALEFVKISGASEEANGVWQVVEIVLSNVIVINLPYESSGNLIGKTVQYYYNNYQVRVKIFAGLNALHPWTAKKPYEEMAELSLTPDDNGEVMFSISDYIKSKVAVKNNLTLFSLPLNLYAFTGFYIQTAESYDYSDGYSIYTQISSFETNTFEGYAIAGKLPFKNLYSGDYADYIYTSGSPAQWLTNMERLIAVEDKYFDISFIKNIIGAFFIRLNWYVEDYLTLSEDTEYSDQGIGVYRIPIVPNSAYDSVCIQAYQSEPTDAPSLTEFETTTGTPPTLAALADWVNAGGPNPGTWTLSSTPDVTVNGAAGVSGYIAGAIATESSFSYEFNIQFEIFGEGAETENIDVTFALLDSSFVEVDTHLINYNTIGVKTPNFTLQGSSDGSYLAMRITNNTPTESKSFELQSAAYVPGPVSYEWTLGANPTVNLPGTGVDPKTSETAFVDYSFTIGTEYTVSLTYTRTVNSGSSNPRTSQLLILNSSNVTQFSTVDSASSGSNTISVTFLANASTTRIGFMHSSGSDVDITITALNIAQPSFAITEEICIDILESCEAAEGFTPEDRRLLEDGDYRLLE